MTEVTPDSQNALPSIAVTESGRVSVSRSWQELKRPSGIVVRCDGASNVTEDNIEQPEKTEFPRVKTEEGTAKSVKQQQPEKA
jgi:hypothetical protein